MLERAHTGTVVSCVALKAAGREIVVTQDDSREIRVWNAKDFSIPLIKAIGRSYNPVWYSQSLTELTLDPTPDGQKKLYFLSGCGAENKVVQYRIDLTKKELAGVQGAFTKGTPAALAQVSQQYYACASGSDVEFMDIETGMCVSSF